MEYNKFQNLIVAFLNYKEGGYNYIGIDKSGST